MESTPASGVTVLCVPCAWWAVTPEAGVDSMARWLTCWTATSC